MSVYTANYVEDKQRREAVVEMMRAGDWRGVIHSFHGGEEARWGRGSVYIYFMCATIALCGHFYFSPINSSSNSSHCSPFAASQSTDFPKNSLEKK